MPISKPQQYSDYTKLGRQDFDDHLAHNSEMVPSQHARWYEVLPVFWAFGLIVIGTVAWKVQELYRRIQ